MKILVVILILVSPTFAADTIEGPNIPTGAFLVVGGSNCPPMPGADYTATWIFVRRPGMHGEGPVVVTHCEYHAGEMLPALPTTQGTYWLFMKSTCNDPALRAVCTRWSRTQWNSGGGDTGCDEPGPAPTPGWTPMGILRRIGIVHPKKPRGRTPADKVEFGRCKTVDGKPVCHVDGK